MIFSQQKLNSVDYYVANKKPNKLLGRFLVYALIVAVILGGSFYLDFKNKKFQDALNRQNQAEKENLQNNWQKLLAKSQKTQEELFYMGIDLAKKNLLDLSAVVLSKVVEKDPNWRDAAYYTGFVYLQLNQNEKAKEYLERARDIDPIYAPTYELLAQVYQSLGDESQAQLCYNKAKDFKVK